MRHKADKILDSNGIKVSSKQTNYKQHEYKKLLRDEAEARDARRKTRSAKQQLAVLNASHHTATRERARLNKDAA